MNRVETERMGKALPYTLVVMVLVVAVVVVVRAVSHGVRNRRQTRLYRDARWRSYRRYDPAAGEWEIGVERAGRGGEVIEHDAMVTLPERATFLELVEQESEAMHRAEHLNEQQPKR